MILLLYVNWCGAAGLKILKGKDGLEGPLCSRPQPSGEVRTQHSKSFARCVREGPTYRFGYFTASEFSSTSTGEMALRQQDKANA